jgi:hypothetical protein
MNNAPTKPIETRIYTTAEGHAVIEQAQTSVVLYSSEQILEVIRDLHTCYDYCSSWRNSGEVSS